MFAVCNNNVGRRNEVMSALKANYYFHKKLLFVVTTEADKPIFDLKRISMYKRDEIFEHLTFDNDFTERAEEYESCKFTHCRFTGNSVEKVSFTDCIFEDCDMSNLRLAGTALNEVRFENCKLLGLHFEDCSPFLFSVSFVRCILDFSSFYGVKLKNTVWKNCSLQATDFTDADLSGARFSECELKDARFENTLLHGADFRTAYNYSLNPELNRIKGAKFSFPGVLGLLHKYDIEVD